MKKPTGYVVYEGASQLNGDPIVMIAITHSTNSKTGDMVQTYILPFNGRSPLDNALNLHDVSVCGDCKHRHGTGGACYVNLTKGVAQVWGALMRGNYPKSLCVPMVECADRVVRMGTYGDPAAVPLWVWKCLLKWAKGHTGYTHQWQDERFRELMTLCMASVDNEEELVRAHAMGYRTFRVRHELDFMMESEFACPASDEELKRKTCNECLACSGGVDTRKANVSIIVHGQLQKRFK